jgi:hypothetical protein
LYVEPRLQLELVFMRYEREEGALVRLEQTYSEGHDDLLEMSPQVIRVASCIILTCMAIIILFFFVLGAILGGIITIGMGLSIVVLILVLSQKKGDRQGTVQVVEFNNGTGRLDDQRQAKERLVQSKQMDLADMDAIHLDVFDQQSRMVWKLYVVSKKESKPYLLIFKLHNKTLTNSMETIRMKEFLLELTDDISRIVRIHQPSVRTEINNDAK